MSWIQVCYHYDGTFAGFLTCVYEGYVHREAPAEFRTPEDPCCSLYPLRTVETDPEHARQVYRSFAKKFGPVGQKTVARGFLTCLPQKELWLWRFIELGYQQGHAVMRNLTDSSVSKVNKAVHHLEEEAHLYTGFVRFSDLDGVLVSQIEPKNRVLPLIRPHFCSRFPQESFFIYDRTHGEALLHQQGRWAIIPVEDFQMGPAGQEEECYRRMWRQFYNTIAIQGRYNPKCRMSHMPKRYWGQMTEFQQEEPAKAHSLSCNQGINHNILCF